MYTAKDPHLGHQAVCAQASAHRHAKGLRCNAVRSALGTRVASRQPDGRSALLPRCSCSVDHGRCRRAPCAGAGDRDTIWRRFLEAEPMAQLGQGGLPVVCVGHPRPGVPLQPRTQLRRRAAAEAGVRRSCCARSLRTRPRLPPGVPRRQPWRSRSRRRPRPRATPSEDPARSPWPGPPSAPHPTPLAEGVGAHE